MRIGSEKRPNSGKFPNHIFFAISISSDVMTRILGKKVLVFNEISYGNFVTELETFTQTKCDLVFLHRTIKFHAFNIDHKL